MSKENVYNINRSTRAAAPAAVPILKAAITTGTTIGMSSKTATSTKSRDDNNTNSSKSTGVMQQMARQLSQALGRRSSTAGGASLNDAGVSNGNVFPATNFPNSLSATRGSITDLPRFLSHNDDF